MRNLWDELVAIIHDKTQTKDKREQATRLLNQYNTAGGRIIEPEIINFLSHEN